MTTQMGLVALSKGTISNLERLAIRAHSLHTPRAGRVCAMKERNSREKGSITASSPGLVENIAHHLKAHYDLAAPMPEHLAELTEKLAKLNEREDGAEKT
jgi:hypothetical protein